MPFFSYSSFVYFQSWSTLMHNPHDRLQVSVQPLQDSVGESSTRHLRLRRLRRCWCFRDAR